MTREISPKHLARCHHPPYGLGAAALLACELEHSSAGGWVAQQSSTTGKPTLLKGGNPQIAKADGDSPVQSYIAAVPGWKRTICKRLDALVSECVPTAQKAVRWNSPMYGVKGHGWFVSFHVFTKYVKVTFFRGTALKPAPPGGTGKDARWVDIHEHDIDETQLKAWIRQAASIPGWGKN